MKLSDSVAVINRTLNQHCFVNFSIFIPIDSTVFFMRVYNR